MILVLVLSFVVSNGFQEGSESQRDAQLVGRITDFFGCALSGIGVAVEHLDGTVIANGLTAADGSYVITKLPSETVRFRITAREFEPIVVTRTLLPGTNVWDAETTVGALSGRPKVPLSGQVIDGDGKPIRDATVTIQTLTGGLIREQLRTRSDGRFDITLREYGQFVVVAVAPGFKGAAAVVTPTGSEQIPAMTLRLAHSGLCTTGGK